MDRKASITYALHSMRMEGFNFTPEEEAMWNKIAKGELPRSAAKEAAAAFDKKMREPFPEKYVQDGE